MWLLIGGDSEIGAAAYRSLKARGVTVAATTRRKTQVATDRPFLDLSAPLENWEPPSGTSAACIFAAVARIEACEADPGASAYVNVTQTLALADRLLSRGIPVLFLSTNQVFDGTASNVAADAPHRPLTEYGRQKARAETGFFSRTEQGMPAAVLRLAKVVSRDMPLLRDWRNKLAAGQPIRAFSDMTMAPVETAMVCDAISMLMKDAARGIFQLTGPRDLSYLEIGRHIAAELGADRSLVGESTTVEARLPAGSGRMHTTLDSSRISDEYRIVPNDALDVVSSVVPSKYRTNRSQ
jgi:dTDP-4-dehydrorhamnose reductase